MNVLLTHKNCPDGNACAAIARIKNPKCEIYFCEHGEPVNFLKLKNKEVVIADFSFPREELLELKKIAKSLLVLDHHKSAEESLKGLDFCIFDMTRCGSMMLWNFFFPEQADKPILLKHIQDRDLWRWELPDSKDFLEGLDMADWKLEEWSEAIANPNSEKIALLISNGKIALTYKKMLLENIMRDSFEATIQLGDETINVIAANSSVLNSDVGNLLANLPKNKTKIGVVFSFLKENFWKYSLRSVGDVDTIRIAKFFGGGGHKNASAFRTKDFILKIKNNLNDENTAKP
ncbi:hypothetical protein IT568_09670 [bacterium]|nr:hypothetical protein [bacterium]